MRRIFIWSLLVTLPVWLCPSNCSHASTVAPDNQSLEDPVEPLAPQKPRTEEEEDRITALALFSTGHTLEQRQELPQALRRYQRALRYDPQALSALRELVPLAFSLNRPDDALRYAARYAQDNSVEPTLLRYSAAYLAEMGDWKGAIKLYEQLDQSLAGEKHSAQRVLLHMDLGRLYFLTERFADAAAAFQLVLEALDKPQDYGLDAAVRKELIGDDGATYELLGETFAEAKQPTAARQAFEQLDKLKPDPAVLALNLARVELSAGNPDKALAELQKFFDSKSIAKGVVPFELLSLVLKEQQQSDQLIPRLEAIREQQPDNTSLAFYLGQQYRKADKLDKAQELFEQALKAEKTPRPTYWVLVDLYRRTNQPAALLNLLAKLGQDSGSADLPEDDAKQLLADDKLLLAIFAIAQEQHAEAKPDDYFALRAAAILAADSKHFDVAEKLFNLAIKAQPKSEAELLTLWGLGLLLAEKYPEAQAVLLRGVDGKAEGDELAALHYYLSGALEMQQKTDEALVQARKAAEEKPHDPRFAGRPAWILYHAKRYNDAQKAYQEFVEQFDSDASPAARASLVEARAMLSNICGQQHNTPQAVEWLEQILDEYPDNAGASNDLGFLWADSNQHLRRAYRMIQMAAASEPDNIAYRDSLGWVLYRLNRYSEALTEMQKAAAGENPDGEILDHLGDVYSKLGQPTEAKASWTRALEAFKKAKESEKIKDVEKKLATD